VASQKNGTNSKYLSKDLIYDGSQRLHSYCFRSLVSPLKQEEYNTSFSDPSGQTGTSDLKNSDIPRDMSRNIGLTTADFGCNL
jgi:hypothetical protein